MQPTQESMVDVCRKRIKITSSETTCSVKIETIENEEENDFKEIKEEMNEFLPMLLAADLSDDNKQQVQAVICSLLATA